jgi:hypothetical protein
MADLRFEKVWFSLKGFDPSAGVTTPEIKPVAEAYEANIERVHQLIGFNARLLGIAIRLQAAASIARFRVTGSPETPGPLSEKETLRIQDIQEELMKGWQSEDLENPEEMTMFLRTTAAATVAIYRRWGFYEQGQIESIFFSMLQGTWTAFEVMAGDLWEAAVNANPKHLSGLHGRSERGDQSSSAEKVIEHGLLHTFLQEHAFDLSKVMGSLHRRSRRFRFTTLDGTRKAYKAAFHKANEGVLEAVNRPDLDALSAVRNVSEDFLNVARKVTALSKWKSLSDGDKMEVDGEDVSNLIAPVVKAGADLIAAVDLWIQKHP